MLLREPQNLEDSICPNAEYGSLMQRRVEIDKLQQQVTIPIRGAYKHFAREIWNNVCRDPVDISKKQKACTALELH
jgi:predicted RNA-binding protein with PIN domain